MDGRERYEAWRGGEMNAVWQHAAAK